VDISNSFTEEETMKNAMKLALPQAIENDVRRG
jgi:hypothetical protein